MDLCWQNDALGTIRKSSLYDHKGPYLSKHLSLCPLWPPVFAVMVLCKKQLQYLDDLQLIFTSHSYKMLGFDSKLSISSGSLNYILIPELKKRDSSWIIFSYCGGQEYKRVCKSGGNSQWLWFYAWKWHTNSSFNPTDQNIGSMPKPSNHWTGKVIPPKSRKGKIIICFTIRKYTVAILLVTNIHSLSTNTETKTSYKNGIRLQIQDPMIISTSALKVFPLIQRTIAKRTGDFLPHIQNILGETGACQLKKYSQPKN